MDIMDSTDTPTGGLDGSTASSGALPLSVDQRDVFDSPSDASSSGGMRATSTIPGESFSSSGSAFDRLDAVSGARVDEDLPNALPTSTDDVMMPTQSYASHPSVFSNDSTASLSTSQSTSAKASEMTSDAKDKASSVMSSLSSKLHEAEQKVSDLASSAKSKASEEYQHLKSNTSSSNDSTPHTVRSTTGPEATDTHPNASSMRDTHLHSNLSSLPTHANENRAEASAAHISSAQTRGLEAAAATEPKDPSASSGGMMAALSGLHQRLEDGVEVVKDKVDGWAEEHLRSTPKAGDHLSEARSKDLPTLVDSSNERNTEYIRAKMHPSGERVEGRAATLSEDALLEDNSA